ncbi:MAG: hypothetical protein WC180_00430 [Candidatus Paceibacterota bacterium]|jgi:hypothetical protein
MSDSMQNDFDEILQKTQSTPMPELGESKKEDLSVQNIKSAVPGMIEDPKEVHQAISFARQLQATRAKASEQEKEFMKNLQTIQEQDPALIKKIKLVGIGIVILLLIFATVIYRNSRDNSAAVAPAVVQKNNATNVQESAADKLKASQNVNDRLRVGNLINIAQLAVVYHLEQKADLPVSATYVKLNENNPVTEYLKDALIRYGNSTGILLDPKDPDFYYAYISVDGRSIELSARIENEDGEYCDGGGSPCIYKKTITEAQMAEMSSDLERYK